MSDRVCCQAADRVDPPADLRDSPKISNLQWYMLRGQSTAYFALHLQRQVDRDEFISLVNLVLDRLPKLAFSYTEKADRFTSVARSDMLAGCRYCRSSNLADDWQSFLEELPEVGSRLNGRVFEAMCFVSDRQNESLITFVALHAAIEGADVENFLRGAARGKIIPSNVKKIPFSKELPSNILIGSIGWLLNLPALLLVAISKRRSADFRIEHLAIERKDLQRLARNYKVSKQALLYALIRSGINRAENGSNRAKSKKIQFGFIDVDRREGFLDDSQVRFQTRIARIDPQGNLSELANRFDAIISNQRGKPPYFQKLALAMAMVNRRIERLIPGNFPEKFYEYLDVTELYSCLPPMALRGSLKPFAEAEVYTGSNGRGCDSITFCTMASKIFIALRIGGDRGCVAKKCLEVLGENGIDAQRSCLEDKPMPQPDS